MKCPKCLSGRISLTRQTIFGKFLGVFSEPEKDGARVSQRYRCGACKFVFVAPDRRLQSRGKAVGDEPRNS
jgi:hypothetical protein